MVHSLKVSMSSPDEEEQFIFVLRAETSGLAYSARLSRAGSAVARRDSGTVTEAELAKLLERMNQVDETAIGERCAIEVTMGHDEVVTTDGFPARQLIDETVVGRVYHRLKGDAPAQER